MLVISSLAKTVWSNSKEHLTSTESSFAMLDTTSSRSSAADIASQRRARRAQPYTPSPVISSSGTRETGTAGVIQSESSGSTSGLSFTDHSSRNSTDSPRSSAGDVAPGTLIPQSSVLQRGSACLTCRKRKLKCDAIKPACTSCARSGRSQTCSYDDGLPKSRVQILTSKVRDLEAKITSMEAERQTSIADTSYQSRPTFPTDLSCPPGSSVTDVALLPRPYTNQDTQTWRSFVPEPAELVNLAASLAVPNSVPLAYPRNELLGTLRKMTPWWELDQIPSGIQQYLINLFLARKWEPGVEIDASRFWTSLSQPTANQPHKCFLNAIYLVACSFSGDKNFEEIQPTLVTKVRKDMEVALVQGDRLIDFIRASSLLSFYYFLKGRLLEGHHLSSTTARFAIACGLHQLGSTHWQPQSEYGHVDTVDDGNLATSSQTSTPRAIGGYNMIPRPRNHIERNEYIHAYWTVHMQDMGAGLVTGLPTSVTDSEVTTPWPIPIETTPPLNSQLSHPTIVSLYSGVPGTADMSQHHHSQALRIKSMCFLARSARLAVALDSTKFPEPSLWHKHAACERAITEAIQTIPIQLDQTSLEWSLMIAASHATLLAAHIQLHGFLAGKNPESREKCLAAANECMNIMRKLQFISVPAALLLLVGIDWMVVKDFYVAEKSRLLAEGNIVAAESLEPSIREIVAEMDTVPADFTGIKL